MKKTVLVVDDQPSNVRLIQINLEREGYRVLTAADGVEGMQRVQETRPDLILLDVIMPRKDGFEMLRELKADPELQDIPVVMLTVDVRNLAIVEGHRIGADLYLPKPFHPKELVSVVRRTLKEPPRGG